MRIRFFSDLHLETRSFEPSHADADLVILAGDIGNGTDGIDWALQHFPCPMLYVAGNHEYFEGEYHAVQEALREATAGTRITLLDCGTHLAGAVRFLGCTLWTDFSLAPPESRQQSIERSRRFNPDYQHIRMGGLPLQPEDTVALCQAHRAWLARELARPFEGTTVVITHFAPHRGSIARQFAGNAANPGFIVPLDELMGPAALWIHGHTHSSFDYPANGTRIVANPRGYEQEDSGFRENWMIEI